MKSLTKFRSGFAVVVAALALPWSAATAATIPNVITGLSTTSGAVGQWDRMDFTCTWAVPDNSAPGDTFTMQLPPELRWYGAADFPLKSDTGDVVATAHADDTGLVVFTLTDFVATHPQDVNGSCAFTAQYIAAPAQAGQQNLEFDVSSIITVPIDVYVCAENCGASASEPNKLMYWMGPQQTVLYSELKMPPMAGTSNVTVIDTPGPGMLINCDQLVATVGTTTDIYDNIVAPTDDALYPAAITCTPESVTVSWTGLPDGERAQVNVVTDVTDASMATYTNTGSIEINGAVTAVGDDESRTDGSGTGNGTSSPTPTPTPTDEPTIEPTVEPTASPTETPTVEPTVTPTPTETPEPTVTPTTEPTVEPTVSPTIEPTVEPTVTPTETPTVEPTVTPTAEPTTEPTVTPTVEPTQTTTPEPTASATVTPEPSVTPSASPSTGTATATATPSATATQPPTETATASESPAAGTSSQPTTPAAATATTPGQGGKTASPTDQLARTGAGFNPAPLAALLLAAGVAVVMVGRRTASKRSH
ncbi:hypothetical protein ANMWB30_09560 [Arthrobacter sp. MWB30]|nr:hypothetical protein ANMWB30_09560 [Arthrobacter sp. MWB30]